MTLLFRLSLFATALVAFSKATTISPPCPLWSSMGSLTVCPMSDNPKGCMAGTNCDTLLATYGGYGCNSTWNQIWNEQNPSTSCLQTLQDLGTGSSTENAAQANTICNTDFGNWLTDVCKLCPSQADTTDLTPLANCLITEPGKLKDDAGALARYDAYACLQTADQTDGIPKACQTDSSIWQYHSCQKLVYEVLADVVGSSSLECDQLLIGPLASYCPLTFEKALDEFCTAKGWFALPFLGPLTGGVFVGLCSGAGVLLGAGFFYYRKKKRENAKVAGALYGGFGSQQSMGSSGQKFGHQSSFTMQTQYQAPVPMSPPNGSHMSMIPPGMTTQSPVLNANSELDPKTCEERKQELQDFYAFHDPSRQDIPGHVESLFQKYGFGQLTSAIQSKYGVLPPGWS